MTSKAKKKLAPRKELTEENNKLPKKAAKTGGAGAGLPKAGKLAPSPASSPAGAALSLRSSAAKAGAERPRPPSIPPDRGEEASVERGASKAKEFRSMKPARSQVAACRGCGWTGVLGDCAERGMGGDAFSEGWAWHCPHCKAVVEVYAWRQLELIATSS